ncbi:hypothetical protein [Spiroplasma endosymbiont of Cantharis rufa]|uniref:hypothetical protein n=1 Tax=Spiroplasma endosymbiont of Cantharis rufa TaxID=3066279 RepID=UPI0030D34198
MIYKNEELVIPEKVKSYAACFAQEYNLIINNKKFWEGIFYKKGKEKIISIINYIREKNLIKEINEDIVNQFYIDSINFRNSCFKIVMFIEELLGGFLSFYDNEFYRNNYLERKTLGGLFKDKKNVDLNKKKLYIENFLVYVNNEKLYPIKIFDNYVNIRNKICHPKFLLSISDKFFDDFKNLKFLMFSSAWKSNIDHMLNKQKYDYFNSKIREMF